MNSMTLSKPVPYAAQIVMLRIETSDGTELAPEDIASNIDIDVDNPSEEFLDAILDYLGDNVEVLSIVRLEPAWYGYMLGEGAWLESDYIGPFASSEEALAAAKEEFG